MLRFVLAVVVVLLVAVSGHGPARSRGAGGAFVSSGFRILYASDWSQFLETQEQLLLSVIEIVHHAGADLAFPSQTMYLRSDPMDGASQAPSKLDSRVQATEIRHSGRPAVKN